VILTCRENTFVSGQEIVNEICDEKRFRKIVGGPLGEIRAFAGDGLFTARTFPVDKSEPNWGKAHRILMPAFGPQSIQSMLPNMLDIGARAALIV
jgi:cytochrome P450 / NADPH-cytochrome P450 reductase